MKIPCGYTINQRAMTVCATASSQAMGDKVTQLVDSFIIYLKKKYPFHSIEFNLVVEDYTITIFQ